MRERYDYVIVGAGPCGLTIATLLLLLLTINQNNNHNNIKIAIVERFKDIGGCHRVERISSERYFSEHGPRIYSDSYVNFIQLLDNMMMHHQCDNIVSKEPFCYSNHSNNHVFDKLFAPYNFKMLQINKMTLYNVMRFSEYVAFARVFISCMVIRMERSIQYYKAMPLDAFLRDNQFALETIQMIDRMARLTDGAGIENYSVHQFLCLLDEQYFYRLYQPREPNDKGLFLFWKTFFQPYIENGSLTLIMEHSVCDIEQKINDGSFIVKLSAAAESINNRRHKRSIRANNVVLAIPPSAIVSSNIQFGKNIRSNADYQNSFLTNEAFLRDTAYIPYICITFHWTSTPHASRPDGIISATEYFSNRKDIYGFPKSAWGIAFIVLSDYMLFDRDQTKSKETVVVISCAVSVIDRPNESGRSANDISDPKAIIDEVYDELLKAFCPGSRLDDIICRRHNDGNQADNYDAKKYLREIVQAPTAAIMSPHNYYDINDKTWKTKDDAFMNSPHVQHFYPDGIPFRVMNGLYSVGTHNNHQITKLIKSNDNTTSSLIRQWFLPFSNYVKNKNDASLYNSYGFTSMETAVTNAIHFVNYISYPQQQANIIDVKYPIKLGVQIAEKSALAADIIIWILVAVAVIMIVVSIVKNVSSDSDDNKK